MKTKPLIIAISLIATLTCGLCAAEPEGHHHEALKAGPSGGRLITKVEPHAEFFVTKERKIEIRFVGDDGKIVKPGTQVVTVTLGDRAAPTKLVFTQADDKLISDKSIPEGNDLPTVVQIREKQGAKPINEKFNLNLDQCPTCKNKEYACTCAHDADEKK